MSVIGEVITTGSPISGFHFVFHLPYYGAMRRTFALEVFLQHQTEASACRDAVQ